MATSFLDQTFNGKPHVEKKKKKDLSELKQVLRKLVLQGGIDLQAHLRVGRRFKRV